MTENTITLDDIIKAYEHMTEHDLTQEEYKIAEERMKKALEDILKTPDKAKLLYDTLGVDLDE